MISWLLVTCPIEYLAATLVIIIILTLATGVSIKSSGPVTTALSGCGSVLTALTVLCAIAGLIFIATQ